MIVYTANFGWKDAFKEPTVVAPGVRYVYYTDEPIESDIWEVVKERPDAHSPILRARWHKLHPHVLFPGETTVWQDANLISIKDPTPLGWCENMLLQIHQFRTDPYEEAEYCIRKKRGNAEDLEKQITVYQNLVRGSGLYEARVIVRKPTIQCSLLNDLWWDQIMKYSARDQVSLPYVLDQLNMDFNVIGHQEIKSYFYKRGGHRFRGE